MKYAQFSLKATEVAKKKKKIARNSIKQTFEIIIPIEVFYRSFDILKFYDEIVIYSQLILFLFLFEFN